MLYKVLLVAKRNIRKTLSPDWEYDLEETAYSDFYHFSTLEKAQAFCQQYVTTPLVWDTGNRMCWAETTALNANIYIEDPIVMDPDGMPPLPTNFSARPDRD